MNLSQEGFLYTVAEAAQMLLERALIEATNGGDREGWVLPLLGLREHWRWLAVRERRRQNRSQKYSMLYAFAFSKLIPFILEKLTLPSSSQKSGFEVLAKREPGAKRYSWSLQSLVLANTLDLIHFHVAWHLEKHSHRSVGRFILIAGHLPSILAGLRVGPDISWQKNESRCTGTLNHLLLSFLYCV